MRETFEGVLSVLKQEGFEVNRDRIKSSSEEWIEEISKKFKNQSSKNEEIVENLQKKIKELEEKVKKLDLEVE